MNLYWAEGGEATGESCGGGVVCGGIRGGGGLENLGSLPLGSWDSKTNFIAITRYPDSSCKGL